MIRYLLGKCWTLFAVVTITAAVLLTFIRLLMPYVSLYQQDIEQWVSQALGQTVQIGSLEAEWHGLGPQLILHNITFIDQNSGGVRASLEQAAIAVDVPTSLVNGELRFGSLTVSGVSLSVIRHRDGSIAVAGLGSASMNTAATPESNSVMLVWLFSQERLALEDSKVIWHDESLSQKGLQFVSVNLELRNDGDQHQFDGSASLPDDLGRRFSFAVDLHGDVFVAGDWGGRAYLNGAGLQTKQLLNWLPLAGVRVDSGIAELRLWSEWQQSRLSVLEGELSVFGLKLVKKPSGDQPSEATEFLDALSGRFSWQRQASGWHLDVSRLILGRWGEFWPQSDFHLDWSGSERLESGVEVVETEAQATDGHQVAAKSAAGRVDAGKLQLWADYLRIDDVTALLQLTDLSMAAVRENIQALQPSGELRQLHVQWQPRDTQIGHLAIDSEFSDLSIQPWQKLPGISGLSGRVIANEQHGQVTLESRSLHFEAQPLFRQTLLIDRLAGLVQWRAGADGWYWSGRGITLGNADLQAGIDVDATFFSNGASPYLDLVAGFISQPDALAHTSAYLPVAIMPKAAVHWLDRALINGRISNGGLIFHGPVKQFPFDQADGQFEVRLVVEDGILDYLPDWPRLEELEAEILFSGRKMAVNAIAGKILKADLGLVQAGIENMAAKPAVLKLSGDVDGGTAEVLRFLQLSPLRQRFGRFVDGAEAGGHSQVELDLQIPLAEDQVVAVNGAVLLQDSEVLLAEGAVKLTQLNGRLGFTASSLSAEDIQGRVMGLEARIAVDTNSASGDVVTTVSANGNATIEEVRAIVDPPLFDQFSGRADWQARLDIPGKAGAEASLQVASDLRGLATNLPAPVEKSADQTLPMLVEMHLPISLDRPVTVQVGDDLSVILDLDEHLQMQRGEIRLADGAAQLPQRAGMRIAGIAPAFSFSAWLPLIEQQNAKNIKSSSAGVNHIAVTVADLELYQRHFEQARVDALLEGNAWLGEVDSKQLKGSVQVPLDDVVPLILDLEHLYLTGIEDNEGDSVDDPRQFPSMRVQSKAFTFNSIDFGRMALTASHNPAGLRLTELRLQSPIMVINAHGDWLVANKDHFSSFNIVFSSPNVGKALSRFGYVDTIKGGKGGITINARWPGAPLSFALARLDGNMHMSIDDGHLLEVDPGVGRVFGLLSLQTLPRRLILDFRDVFSKGFAFDRIAGDFDIKDGQALTSNLYMKGPAARIMVDGRVGLAERDYDQQVTVVPDVAATVPLITALTQGPGLGAAVLLLQKLLEPNIDKAATIQYTVTGSWENPTIKRLPDEVSQPQKKK